jgi:hypothetical protein
LQADDVGLGFAKPGARELSRLPGEQTEINAALAAIDGTRPENETAAMLASQMALTHKPNCRTCWS